MSSPVSPTPYPSLSVSEARALMIAEIDQPRSRPLFSAETTRRPSSGVAPRLTSHYDNLAEQVCRGNVMQRTHHVVRCEAYSPPAAPLLPSAPTFLSVSTLPDTPDENIRCMFRRRSFVTCPRQFDDQQTSESLY